MTRRFTTFFASSLAVLALLAAVPAVASASVISDCTDNNSLDGNYSASELKNALGNIPADVDQYYGCSDLIRQELLNKADKNADRDGKGGGGGEELNAAATDEQLERAERRAEKAVEESLPAKGAVATVDGTDVERSGAKTLASSAAPGTPAALIVALAGLLLLFLGDLAARGVKRGASPPGPTDDPN